MPPVPSREGVLPRRRPRGRAPRPTASRRGLLHELRAERSGDDDFTFRTTLRPTFRTTLRAALGPATLLHPGDQTRPHGNLFRDDPLQLTGSVAPLGKHPQYRPQVPALPRRRLRLDTQRRRLDHPQVPPAHQPHERRAPQPQPHGRRRIQRIRNEPATEPSNICWIGRGHQAGPPGGAALVGLMGRRNLRVVEAAALRIKAEAVAEAVPETCSMVLRMLSEGRYTARELGKGGLSRKRLPWGRVGRLGEEA